jgi:hypothetical protein
MTISTLQATTQPKHHWAFFLEIEEGINEYIHISDNCLKGFSHFGERVLAHFNIMSNENYSKLLQSKTFDWKDLKAGNTLAMLYSQQRLIESEFGKKYGVRIDSNELDKCIVLKDTVESVLNEAYRLLKDADFEKRGEMRECFGCGIKTDTLQRCSRCKLTKYCSKVLLVFRVFVSIKHCLMFKKKQSGVSKTSLENEA